MKKYLFFAAAIAATLASCSSDAEDAPAVDNSSKIQTYTIGSKPFEFVEETTRTIFTLEKDKGLLFSWDLNEEFGVYPIDPVNNQAVWKLNRTGSYYDHYAQFSGAGWGLEKYTKYAAYHPYNGNIPSNTPHTAVPVTMPAEQEGTLKYLGDHLDFMCDTSTYLGPAEDALHNDSWEGGDDSNRETGCWGDVSDPGHEPKVQVTFDFDHSIAIVQIKVPYDDDVTDIQIVAKSGEPFITTGTWNLETGVVTGKTFTNTITLTTPETVENGVATYYAAIFPTTTGECSIAIHKNGMLFGNDVTSKTLEAGKAYRWNVTNN